MPETSKTITSARYSQGLTYDAFMAQLAGNRERFLEHAVAFKLSPEDATWFRNLVARFGGIKALAIAEDWCPDVQRGLPVVARIAEASGIELRVFCRDKNPDIMNLYLKDGKFQSIPVFAFFGRNMEPLCHWIERPAIATRFMEQVAADLSGKNLGDDEAKLERRKRAAAMAESWRQETVRELKELLAKAGP